MNAAEVGEIIGAYRHAGKSVVLPRCREVENLFSFSQYRVSLLKEKREGYKEGCEGKAPLQWFLLKASLPSKAPSVCSVADIRQ